MITTQQEHILAISVQGLESIQVFAELISKLKNKPKEVGFSRKDFTKEEKELINTLYEDLVDE